MDCARNQRTDEPIVSQPEYSKAHSLRSSSASDDYFSDYATDVSSNSERRKAQYETPPSKISTPNIRPQQTLESEATLPARPIQARIAPLDTRSRRLEGSKMEFTDARQIMNRSPPTPGVDDGPYIKFALDQLTRDEELMGHGRQGSVISGDYPVDRVIGDQGLGYTGPPAPPSHPPQQPGQSPQQHKIKRKPLSSEIMLPIAAPTGTQWADLGYRPAVLRLPSLLALLFACILMIAGILFSNIYALRNNGLFDYDGIGTARYFVFQFLPQLLGILLVLWLFVVQAAIYRILPFLAMTSRRPRHGILQNFRIYSANYVLPDLSFFRHGEPLDGIIMLTFWLINFTIPLLSSFYQTVFIMTAGPSRWRWTAVRAVGWTLTALYALLAFAIIGCIFRFNRKRSALRWDPASLADCIPLFQRSNILTDFERSEISNATKVHIPERNLRLGHWTTSKSEDIFYGVGVSDTPVDRLSYPSPIARSLPEKSPRNINDSTSSFDVERQRYSHASSFTRDIHSPFIRYRHVPWFLRDSAVLAWIIIALILLIAFLVVSFLHNAVLRGFLPLLPSGTENGAFSPSNFLYSFLPASLGTLLFLAWQPIDLFFRYAQPFANLSSTTGATAAHSLLLSYPAQYPILVTLRALLNHDYKVAYTSFISVASLAIPVLAGGIFTAQFFSASNSIRMAATMPAYYALCAFLALYTLSLCLIWPKRKRYLPHAVTSYADILTFLYASPLLTSDLALSHIRTKADLVGRLMFAPQGLDTRREARYAFGIYIGRDGKEHLGIDRLERPGEGMQAGREMLVTTGGGGGSLKRRSTDPSRGGGSRLGRALSDRPMFSYMRRNERTRPASGTTREYY